MLQTSTKGDTKKRMQAMVRKQAGRCDFSTLVYNLAGKRYVALKGTILGDYENVKPHALR